MVRALAGLTLGLMMLFAAPLSSVGLAAGGGGFSNPVNPSATDDKVAQAYRRGVKAVNKEDYATALKYFTKVVNVDPDNVDGLNYLGFTLRQMGELDKAYKAYKRALVIDPKHKGAHEYLGELFLKRGEPGKAKTLLSRLDEICPFGCEEERQLRTAIADYEAAKAQ